MSTAVAPPATELATGLSFRARSGAPGLNELFPIIRSKTWVARLSASYVTGSHALKVGFENNPGTFRVTRRSVGDYLAVLLNAVPTQAQFYTTPYNTSSRFNRYALFVQDQWTFKRATFNLGARYDRHLSSYDAVSLPATYYLPARSFTGADVLDWKDLSPRLGLSYDMFGNGRTALKVSLSRYLAAEGAGTADNISPAVTSTARLARSWVDSNGDFIPQGDPTNPAAQRRAGWSLAERELGSADQHPERRPGVARRLVQSGLQLEFNVGIQHEIVPRVAVSASYDRRMYGNFTAIDNLAVAPSDYDTYCITTPVDAAAAGRRRAADLRPLRRDAVEGERTRSVPDAGVQLR